MVGARKTCQPGGVILYILATSMPQKNKSLLKMPKTLGNMLKKTNWKHFYLLLNGRKNKRKLPDLTALCQLTLCRIDISGEKNEEELFKMYKQCEKQTK